MAVQLSTPLDLLQIAPVITGYQPTECVIAVALTDDQRQVSYAMRLDLDAALNQPEAAARQVTDGNPPLLLAAFAAIQDNGREALTRLMAAGVTPPMPVALASLDGWTWIDPDAPDTVQPMNPWDADTEAARAALETQAGMTWPQQTEAELAERYGTTPDAAPGWADKLTDAAAAATGRDADHAAQVQRHQTEVAQWVTDHLGTRITADQAAYIVARISPDANVRDAGWVMITTDAADDHLDLWTQVADHAGPHQEAIAPLYVAAMAALVTGGTMVARLIRERAELLPGADQNKDLAMIRQLTRTNVRQTWPQARAALYREVFGHRPPDE